MDKKNKTILVVDDEKDFLELMKSRLEASGYDVATASNSKEAIDLAEEREFDLILMDLVLEGNKNGVEIFKEIRKIRPDAKAILITAYGPEEESRLLPEAWMAGIADDFLRKPVDPATLINAIEKHIGGKN